MSILETNQYLRSELEKSKQNFRDLTEKFLMSKATAYSLANQLQKYECDEYKALIEAVLAEKVQPEAGNPGEGTQPAEGLGSCDPLIQAQAQELTELRQRIQEGKAVCYLFTQHVKNTVQSFEALLRCTDVAHSRGQRFCEHLAQGSQLAESLASKLTTGPKDLLPPAGPSEGASPRQGSRKEAACGKSVSAAPGGNTPSARPGQETRAFPAHQPSSPSTQRGLPAGSLVV
ncbi:PREDICTED: neuroblastoma breakpoint family member 6-like protein [Condylura cristata]|uniref:neuroblastoma breakpoint family member 6-like protein n=1 Tax=Condylura cristata TaxID=143302 RepID=UPI000642FBE7|nr:PREDICTED: neuroblastoma breakpoint family member 6-like protein [Condylura cristata]